MIYHSPIIAFSSKVLLRMRSFVKLTKFIYLGMANKTKSRSTLIVKNLSVLRCKPQYFPITTCTFIDFQIKIMMHARPIRPHKIKQLPNSFGLTGLAPMAWHKLRLSLYIFNRILFVLNLSKSGLAYLQEINSINRYI